MKIVCNFTRSTDLIEPNYRGDCERQMPIYLEIDWEKGTIDAVTRNYNIGGVPAREHYGLVSAYRLSDNVAADQLAGWIQERLMERIEELAQHFSARWDGSNLRGHFDLPAEELWEFDGFMDRECSNPPSLMAGGGLWDIGDWLTSPVEGLTGNTTDEELQAIARELIDEAECQDVVLDGNVVEYLKNLRNEMRMRGED